MNQETSSRQPEIPSPTLESARPHRRLAAIWIVPIIAMLVGLGLAVQAIMARGPEITLDFSHAEGLEAKKTKIRFKDVEIGTVQSIALNEDRKSVRATVLMDRQASTLLDRDSRFWVVRPRISAGNISGLNTLLSGAYIAIDPGKSGVEQHHFTGLDVPPPVTSDTPGRPFLLTAEDLGSLDIGVPVYFRRIPVGRVIGYELRKDGKGVDVRAFVDAPYDRFVNESSRFWHASGINVSLDANGARLDMQSLLSLALGGIAFSSPGIEQDEANLPAAAETSFVLHRDEATAHRIPERSVEKYTLLFYESVRGLSVGAPVDFRGIVLGEVTRVALSFDQPSNRFGMAVDINLYPERILRLFRNKQGRKIAKQDYAKVLDQMVARGFRAQLQTGNLLSGQRFVALDFFPQAKPAGIDWKAAMPILPTQPGMFDSLQDQVMLFVDTLRHTLQDVDRLVVRLDKELTPELAATLRGARQTLENANQTLGKIDQTLTTTNRLLSSDAPLQLELRETLREVGKAAATVRNLADLLERQPEALLRGKKGE